MSRRRGDAERRLLKPAVLGRYWLAQLPGTVLVALVLVILERLLGFGAWLVVGGVAAWVAKDALLYPLLWRAFDTGYPDAHSLVGERAVAAGRIDPTGLARVRGELWRAELAPDAAPVEAGEAVIVEAMRELTLIVRPAPTA